jgi:hypothetical protein
VYMISIVLISYINKFAPNESAKDSPFGDQET